MSQRQRRPLQNKKYIFKICSINNVASHLSNITSSKGALFSGPARVLFVSQIIQETGEHINIDN